MKNIPLIMIFLAFMVSAQEEKSKDSLGYDYIVIKGDSILRTAIDLEEVIVFKPLKFDSKEKRLQYYILKRKTLKVYPYAKLSAERLTELNKRLEDIKKRRKRKKYTKRVQKYIEGEFSDELKKLTRTEGQILVKLIHRQTGKTAFTLVKELRNGWRAFWYNATAKAFKISLKREYHPEEIEEDFLIEDILQRAFASGRLEKQAPASGVNYSSLSNKWAASTAEKN
ncbi:DUF4294 domain-containing protein [Flavobacteriaceae bacterium R38]|nr:DUF4294 domain-containing protein [Flavobacteriaceae bacterium R38]